MEACSAYVAIESQDVRYLDRVKEEMCSLIGSLTGLALVVLVILHPIGWLVLLSILLISGTAGLAAFIKGLLRLGSKE